MIGVWTLCLSLLVPLITLQAADAAAANAQDQQQCDPGFMVDPNSGECVPEEGPDQQQPTCNEGETLDPNTGQCVPNQPPPPPDCNDGETFDPNTGQCVPDEQPTQQPECGEGETLDPNTGECAAEEAETIYLSVMKYECPEGTDWYQASQGEFSACNQSTNPVRFNVTSPKGEVSSSSLPGSQDYGPWEAGTVTVQEEVPEGYGEPRVFCGSAPTGETAQMADVGAGSSTSSTVDPGETLRCEFYNIPTGGDGNSVTVYKWQCQPGTESGGVQDYYLGQDQDEGPCETEHLNIPITLADANGDHATTTQANGTQWDNVELAQSGVFRISEEIPDGYGNPIVFCGSLEDDEQQPVPATDGMIDVQPGAEPFTYQCNWYNIPTGDGISQIVFEKYWCPEGLAFDQAPTESDLVTACQESGPETSFALDGPGAPHDDKTVDGSPGSSGTWENLAQGSYTVTENFPQGTSYSLQVFCHTADIAGQQANGQAPQEWDVVNGNSIQWASEPGMIWICAIFNTPIDEDYNYVDFYKYLCPPDAPSDADQSYYQQNCQPVEGWEFDLQYTNGGSTQTTDSNGYASWSGLPTGTWTASESLPEGYGDPIVYCRYVEWPDEAGVTDEWAQFDAPGGEYSNGFGYEGMRIECEWYNFGTAEEGNNQVDFYKLWCPEGTSYAASTEDLSANCAFGDEPVQITLQYGSETSTKETAGQSPASWTGLPQGSWTIQELDIPEGYGLPIIYCQYVGVPEDVTDIDENPFPLPVSGGSASHQFVYDDLVLQCVIFNIPLQDPSYISVFKWYCAEGIAPDSDPEYLRENCDQVTTGVDFSLQYGETSVPMTTNSEGIAKWGGIPGGTWRLKESPQKGYGAPVVYCQYSNPPDGSGLSSDLFAPQMDGLTASGEFQHPGLQLFCYWFNFEGGFEEGAFGDNWITIYKYRCTEDGALEHTLEDTLDAYQQSCTETMDGMSFELTMGMYSSTKVTSGGTAQWTGLGGGKYSLAESLPPGYGEPKIWCGYNYRDDEPVLAPSYEAWSQGGSTIEGEVDESGSRLVCFWFNFPGKFEESDVNNVIVVSKYTCAYEPVGFSKLNEWLEACPERGDGVGFTLTDSNGPQYMETKEGKSSWTGVAAGSFKLAEEPQAGYGDPVVWCGWDSALIDVYPQLVATSGTTYQGEITDPNTVYFCYWFNIPVNDSSITVYKYNCPEGMLIEDSLGGFQTACTESGDGIEFTLDNADVSSSKTIMGGVAKWYGVPQGEFTLTENLPPGYGDPVWWCGFTGYQNGAIADGFPQKVEATGGAFSASIDFDVTSYFCWVFNYPDEDRTVTTFKWLCPEGLEAESEDFDDWKNTCTTAMSGVNFTLTDGNGSFTQPTFGGKAKWYGTTQGVVRLDEHIPPGFFEPKVYCSLEAMFEDGAAYAEGPTEFPASDGNIKRTLDYTEYEWVCNFFNIPKGDGEVTIYKWNCPPGYDIYAWGANPEVDCAEAVNGVTFTLSQPVGPDLMTNTGDSADGAVYFGELDPGSYVVTESVPTDTDYVFVLDCVGTYIPKVHPVPLSWGNVLNLDVAGGDSIVCNWYNVPGYDRGTLELHKYACSTETYVSEVNCEIYEFGATFELFKVDGNVSQGTGTTNAGGSYTWYDLDTGSYSLTEISHDPCKITSTSVDDEGNANVTDGVVTVIKVYNCTPGKPGGKIPGKYPNTGVGPDSGVALPSLQDTSEGTATPTNEIAAEDFYEISCLNDGVGGESTPAADQEPDGEGASGLPPFLQAQAETPKPTAEAEAEGTPSSEARDCERGAIPERMVINAANVDNEVEVLEIIDGVMQAPTGPNVVSWYKETARLGESNNVVMAAHVNWWNVPQGVFYHLQDLEEGERVEITGEDGKTYVYEVEWVRQESNLAAPDPEVVGPTDVPSLTMITCGGEWDPTISEYNERTVARAVQVDVIDAEDDLPKAGDGSNMMLAT